MTTNTEVHTSLRATCARDELAGALGVVTRALAVRGAVQVLGGVRLTAEGGRLELAATDMELSVRAEIAGEVSEGGRVVVPGRLFADLVRLLPAETVILTHEEGQTTLTVSSGRHTARLTTLSVEDFPQLPSLEVSMQEVPASALLATIEKVARAASRDDSRPVLTGILVRFEGPQLTMAATDSYRLAVKETPLPAPGPDLDAIIPARALQEVTRLAGATETVELGIHENHVVFAAADVWLTTRRIDGQFPNYRQLLPDAFEVELELPRGPLLETIRRAAVLTQRNTPLRLRFSSDELRVSAQTQDVGEAEETLPIAYGGEPLEIGFNPEFLRDGLEAIGAETVEVKLINPLRPGLLASPSEGFWYLIMPIRLAG
ncbi:MAG: DNA polymerase III subunit beta [Thermoleophilia bacterium]|nr:DNA polymerase III subunit beta [Gaiellaceae bacterium]MDW8338328.1 DNA polymerase III subunit beta [Thermoleophilia bacterium]